MLLPNLIIYMSLYFFGLGTFLYFIFSRQNNYQKTFCEICNKPATYEYVLNSLNQRVHFKCLKSNTNS